MTSLGDIPYLLAPFGYPLQVASCKFAPQVHHAEILFVHPFVPTQDQIVQQSPTAVVSMYALLLERRSRCSQSPPFEQNPWQPIVPCIALRPSSERPTCNQSLWIPLVDRPMTRSHSSPKTPFPLPWL